MLGFARPSLRAVVVAIGLSALLAVCDRQSPVAPSGEVRQNAAGGPPPASSGPPAVAQDASLVGAADIGTCNGGGSAATAALLDEIPGPVFTAGDNVYQSGTEREFRECYEPHWGRHRARTRPVPGNHDYETPGASAYFAYFGAAAGMPGLGYYAYRIGAWDVYALNSNIPMDDQSPQYRWLEAELRQRASRCSLAYWHHPVVSEGRYGGSGFMLPVWRLLYRHGVELVLTGHDHNYQRFSPLDGELRRDAVNGIRQFVVGTGGAAKYPLAGPAVNTENRAVAWGVLRLGLHATSYEWEFLPVPGETFRDFGRDECH
jgi:hypothetical protein